MIAARRAPYYLLVNRFYFALTASLACSALAPLAAAAENVSLRYSAAPGCPPQAEFETALSARGAGLESRGTVRALDIVIAAKEPGFWGTLRVVGENESSSTREVHANECAEVVKGLAVVAAIALGGKEEKPEADSAKVTPAAADAQPSAPAEAPVAPKADDAPRRLRGNSFKHESEIEVNAGTLRVDRVYDLTLSAGASFSLIPDLVVPRYELTERVTHFITPPGGSSRLIGPTVEVSVNMLGPLTREAGDFRTQVFGVGASVRACSALTYDSQGFSAHFCSEFGLTAFQFDTKDADGKVTQKKSTGIGIAGVGLGVQYNIGRYFHVGANVSGQAQIGGASAERPDGSTLFKVPLFGGNAIAGVGVHF